MFYLLARQRVADFDRWKAVFDSHADAQRDAGLILERVVRNLDDATDVVAWFQVIDLEAAKRFVTSEEVPDAQEQSGVLGQPEIVFMEWVP